MKIVYKDIELQDYDKNSSQPLRYRVSLKKVDNNIEMKREYFKSGFNDGECDDVIFSINSGYFVQRLSRVSIMTQKVDDVEYLKSFEKMVIQEYIKRTKELIPELVNYLKRETKTINDEIKDVNESLKFLSNYDRREKLKNINKYEKT